MNLFNLFNIFKKKEEPTAEVLEPTAEVEGPTAEVLYKEAAYKVNVTHDPLSAVRLYAKAAQMGLKEAQYDFAVCNYYGYGIKENKLYAAELLKPLADEMQRAAEFLAMMYYKGEGVDKDLRLALKYFQGGMASSSEVVQFLGATCLDEIGDKDAESVGKIMECLTKVAESGVVEAKANLGMLYYDGALVPKDDKSAFKWFKDAADAGKLEGLYHVGLFYQNGIVVEKDWNKAKRFYDKGQSLGDERCAHGIRVIHNDGWDVEGTCKKVSNEFLVSVVKKVCEIVNGIPDMTKRDQFSFDNMMTPYKYGESNIYYDEEKDEYLLYSISEYNYVETEVMGKTEKDVVSYLVKSKIKVANYYDSATNDIKEDRERYCNEIVEKYLDS